MDDELIGKVTSRQQRYIRCVYLLRSDDTPQFNPADFVSAEWLYPEEVLQKIDAGHPAKDSLRPTVVLLQNYLKQTGYHM